MAGNTFEPPKTNVWSD